MCNVDEAIKGLIDAVCGYASYVNVMRKYNLEPTPQNLDNVLQIFTSSEPTTKNGSDKNAKESMV